MLKVQNSQPNTTENNGCALGCLIGAITLPSVVVGISFMMVGVDGQFGLTMVMLAPIGAIVGGIIGAVVEATRKRNI